MHEFVGIEFTLPYYESYASSCTPFTARPLGSFMFLKAASHARASAPVRILRDNETLQHVTINGLFPCGEGAGYAGGIVSAGIDGERCAEAVATYLGIEED